MLLFTPPTSSSYKTFNQVISQAKKRIDSLKDNQQKALKEKLSHGLGLLDTFEELDMYLALYGEIHQAKLLQDLEKIPDKLWVEKPISAIDYGCGQGIAEMILGDFLRGRYIKNDLISDFTLIEPSMIALSKAKEYIANFYPGIEIKAIPKKVQFLMEDDIGVPSPTCIHFLSNVIDIPDFPIERVAQLVNMDYSHNNILVCVSSFYPEDGRGQRMDDFAQMLHHYHCEYSFQKHIDEWDKPFSCQIRIFISSYF